MANETQLQKLARFFENNSTITNIEAQNVFRIRALPRRIKDLEERGYRFTREDRRDAEGQRYRRYYLERAPVDAAIALGAVVPASMRASMV